MSRSASRARTSCAAIVVAALTALVVLSPGARALQPDEVLTDPALEKRARSLSLELRCLVCQNQSIDDSDAPLARDLRVLVRERLAAGDSDADIRSYLVARYGDFVLLRPPFDYRTLLLWIAPFLVLLAAVVAVLRQFRRSPAAGASAPVEGLTDAEARRLKALLDAEPGDQPGSQTKPR